MTLLILEIHVPMGDVGGAIIGDDHTLLLALLGLWPHLITYFMSFLTLGIYWVAQQTQFSYFTRSDRDLTWIHLGFLLIVSILPFSTGLLAEYTGSRIALIVYWSNIFMLGMMLLWSIRYAKRAGLMKTEASTDIRTPSERRIFVAQTLYTIGLLLCVINTYWSIAFLILVQLNFVIAPRIPLIDRIGNRISHMLGVQIHTNRAPPAIIERESVSADVEQNRLTDMTENQELSLQHGTK